MGFICAVCGEKKSGFSMPYQIFGKDGREYPACIACSKIYDALGSKGCVITWQRFKRPCRRPPAIPLKGTESKHTAALYARRL